MAKIKGTLKADTITVNAGNVIVVTGKKVRNLSFLKAEKIKYTVMPEKINLQYYLIQIFR